MLRLDRQLCFKSIFHRFLHFCAVIIVLNVCIYSLICAFIEKPANKLVYPYHIYYVASNSMEPSIMENALILTKKVTDKDVLKTGDIISFFYTQENSKKINVTHRIVKITDDLIYTKGDHNNKIDPVPICRNLVLSKVVFIFNGLAQFNSFADSGYVFFGCMCIIVILVILFAINSNKKSRFT